MEEAERLRTDIETYRQLIEEATLEPATLVRMNAAATELEQRLQRLKARMGPNSP